MDNQIDQGNIPKQAIQVVEIAEELFENQLIGIYLYGSAILGGLHPNSDVDVLLITNHEMPGEIRNELTKQLMTISGEVGCTQKRPLEVTVINQGDMIPWQFPPKCEYMYGEWLREEMEAGGIPQPYYDPDIAILLQQARGYSVPLKGPKAMKLIPPIPISEIRKAMKDSLPGLVAGVRGDERNVLLTLARMWFTAATGEICPKDVASKWVLPKLPPDLAPLLEMAQNAYLGQCSDKWEGVEIETALLVGFMENTVKSLLADT